MKNVWKQHGDPTRCDNVARVRATWQPTTWQPPLITPDSTESDPVAESDPVVSVITEPEPVPSLRALAGRQPANPNERMDARVAYCIHGCDSSLWPRAKDLCSIQDDWSR